MSVRRANPSPRTARQRSPMRRRARALTLPGPRAVAFCNDVGEGYMTFPPRGHGVELAAGKLYSEQVPEGQLYAD